MKSNELRIGNWIKHDMFDKPMQVIGINIDDDRPRVGLKNKLILCGGEWKPIPLTEEWLLKFGFEAFKKFKPGTLEKTEETEFITFIPRLGMALYYSKYPWENEYHYAVLKNMTKEHIAILKYVHQLQNLYFALTGEEITTTE